MPKATVAPETLETAYHEIVSRGQMTAKEVAETLKLSVGHGRNIVKKLYAKGFVTKMGSRPEFFVAKDRAQQDDFHTLMLVWEALESTEFSVSERHSMAMQILRDRYSDETYCAA